MKSHGVINELVFKSGQMSCDASFWDQHILISQSRHMSFSKSRHHRIQEFQFKISILNEAYLGKVFS
jgi:hypothetical protein